MVLHPSWVAFFILKQSCALISPVNNIPIVVFSGTGQHTPDTLHATNGGGQGGRDDQDGQDGLDGQGG